MLEYITTLFIKAAIFALFSLGLNLQWGFAGLVNFGHVAFMSVGAYTTVLLTLNGVPVAIAFLLASALAGLLGLIIGSSTLKLREDYLGIVTIGVAEIIQQFITNDKILIKDAIMGLQNFPLPFVDLLPRQNYSLVLASLLIAVTGLVYWGLEILVRSPWGRVLKAIREDEEVAKALGKNVFWYKLQAFVIGGVIGGMSGAFYAWQLTTIYPSSFNSMLTFQAWTIVTIGGTGKNSGVLLGALIFEFYNALPRFLPKSLSSDGSEAIKLMLIANGLATTGNFRKQKRINAE
jgi:ABC-type branched-subunit amino acid transport system permease subunit